MFSVVFVLFVNVLFFYCLFNGLKFSIVVMVCMDLVVLWVLFVDFFVSVLFLVWIVVWILVSVFGMVMLLFIVFLKFWV